MKIVKYSAAIVIVMVLLTLFIACPDYNSPMDRESNNYQGFTTVATVNEVVPSLTTGQELVFLTIDVSECLVADRYQLQISATSGNFTSPVYDNEYSSNVQMNLSDAGLTAGTWYCRTRAGETGGDWGDWSSEVSFTAASIDLGTIVPENSGSIEDTTPLLKWDDVTGVVSYQVRYASTEGGFPTATVNNAPTSQYQYPSTLAIDDTVYWQVRGVNGDGVNSAWSAINHFIVLSIPTEGLVAEYLFDGNADDTSGNGNNGIVNGATLSTDRFGNINNAYTFDGIDDWIDIEALDIYSEITFSVSFWMLADLNQNEDLVCLIDKEHGFVTPYTGWNFQLFTDTGILETGVAWNDGSNKYKVFYTQNSLLDSSYHHNVLIFDGNSLAFYVDGIKIGEAIIGNVPWQNNRNINIGRTWGGGVPKRFYKGIVDDVRIYDRSLDVSEILSLYEEGGYTSP